MPAPEVFTVRDLAASDAEENAPSELPEDGVPVTPEQREAFKAETQARVTDDAPLAGHTTQAAEAPTMPPIPQDGSLVSVILAVVAVVGGGTAWRFYSQASREKSEQRKLEAEQAHEQAMARINAEASRPTAQHPSCIQAHADFGVQLSQLRAELEQVKASTSVGLPDGFDADEMSERIAKLEKAAKAKPKPPGRKS
jgi:hypothetical protein